MSKPKIARKKRPPSSIAPVEFESATSLMRRVKAPLLTLDDVVLVSDDPAGSSQPALAITGKELAELLSLRRAYPTTAAVADAGDVNLRLRGLADLLYVQRSEEELGENAIYFVAQTLEDLAARLETSSWTESFRVGLLRPRSEKAVAS